MLENFIKTHSYDEYEKLKSEYECCEDEKVHNAFQKCDKRFTKQFKIIEEYKKRQMMEFILHMNGYRYIAGIDEVGRGPLAGSVYAAAVILDIKKDILGIKDSKKLSSVKRDTLSKEIKQYSLSWSIGKASVEEIDKLNILNATKLAMKRAVAGLSIQPQILLIDAVKLPDIKIEQISIIKGDDKSVSIGAASIIAKVERDSYMNDMSKLYPEYKFESNKGYGTSEHISALKKFGPCSIHRKTFIKNFIGENHEQ